MVSEDYIAVLLFDRSDASAKIISKSFSSIDVPHQIRHIADSGAVKEYLKASTGNNGSDKLNSPALIVIHANPFDAEIESLIEYIKGDAGLKRFPVLIFSASKDNQNIETAYRLKANSYIVCPENPEEIEKVVKDVASYWLNWNQLPS